MENNLERKPSAVVKKPKKIEKDEESEEKGGEPDTRALSREEQDKLIKEAALSGATAAAVEKSKGKRLKRKKKEKEEEKEILPPIVPSEDGPPVS